MPVMCVKNSVRILYIQRLSNFRLKSTGYGLRPVATMYTSRERAREESGLSLIHISGAGSTEEFKFKQTNDNDKR